MYIYMHYSARKNAEYCLCPIKNSNKYIHHIHIFYIHKLRLVFTHNIYIYIYIYINTYTNDRYRLGCININNKYLPTPLSFPSSSSTSCLLILSSSKLKEKYLSPKISTPSRLILSKGNGGRTEAASSLKTMGGREAAIAPREVIALGCSGLGSTG